MNEQEFARRLAGHLSASARAIDGDLAARLRAAREQALAVQRRPGRFARLASREWLRLMFPPVVRSAAAIAVVLAVLLVGDYWTTLSRVAAMQDVDMALLADDLPIDAYLDSEFREWLQRDSQS